MLPIVGTGRLVARRGTVGSTNGGRRTCDLGGGTAIVLGSGLHSACTAYVTTVAGPQAYGPCGGNDMTYPFPGGDYASLTQWLAKPPVTGQTAPFAPNDL